MPKRKLPHWLLCKEFFLSQPNTLYIQCFIKCWEDRVFEDISWWHNRYLLPKVELEAVCSDLCWKPYCVLQFEPHTHIIDTHEWMLFTSASHTFIDNLKVPSYINNTRRQPGPSCKRRLFE